VPPATHVPVAPPAPQPWHVWFTSSVFPSHVSPPIPHRPAVVTHPVPPSQPASQHSFPAPTPHVVDVAVHVHALHTSPLPEQ
jgi:hypothetical protein